MAKAKARAERQETQTQTSFFDRHLREFAAAAALAVAVWLVFAQTTGHGYINFDDYDYVADNPAVMNGLSWEGVKFAFTTPYTANWHPLTWLSHMLDVSLFGDDPGAMHGMNGWLHAMNAILLFALLRYLTGAFWRSGATAMLFAIHPLHVEPVAWLSDRKDLLATFFWLACAFAWTYGIRENKGPRWKALAHLLGALAMMSKPTAVALPVTLLLLDLWPLGRWTRFSDLGKLALEKSVFFLMAVGVAVATYIVQRDLGATTALFDVALDRRIANAIASYGVYLIQTVLPSPLCPMYPFPPAISWAATGASIAVLVVVSALVLRRTSTEPYLAAGWFWYLLALAPMAGFVQVGIQAHADRYTYVSLIGIFWVAAWGLRDLLGEESWRTPILRGAAAAALALLAYKSYTQTALWRDDTTLFGYTLAVTKDNRVANTAVGLAHLRAQNYDQAESHLRTALSLEPKFMPAYRNLAEVLHAKKQDAEALKLLNKALELEPKGQLTYYYRGLVHRGLGKKEEAIADFQQALKMGLTPDEEKRSYLEMGRIRTEENKHEEALLYFQKAVEVDPQYFLGLKNLAYAHLHLKHIQEARKRFEFLGTIAPGDPDVRNVLKALNPGR